MTATRTQDAAARCFALVDEIKRTRAELSKEYGRHCTRFGPLVLANGLVQTVGFLEAKAAGEGPGARAARLFLDHLGELLGQRQPLAWLRAAPLGEYLRATRQALALAQWFKRYAQGHLGVDATD